MDFLNLVTRFFIERGKHNSNNDKNQFWKSRDGMITNFWKKVLQAIDSI